MIAHRFVIHYRAFDFWVIAVLDLLTGLNAAHGEAERRLAFFVLSIDLLRGFKYKGEWLNDVRHRQER